MRSRLESLRLEQVKADIASGAIKDIPTTVAEG
jgi:hypothetical protein